MIEGQTKRPEGAESVRALAYDFRFPIETFYRACCDPRFEIVHEVFLVSAEHPGEIPHRF